MPQLQEEEIRILSNTAPFATLLKQVFFVGFFTSAVFGASGQTPSQTEELLSSSSSFQLVDSPEGLAGYRALASMQALESARGVRSFSALAVAVKVGTGGIGFDLATPLSARLNLRGGGSFYRQTITTSSNGLNIVGDLKLRTVAASLDVYPFRNSFRISPGLTMYNNTNVAANVMVPPGQQASFGDQTYVSDPNDPIHGTAALKFGNRVAPRLTVGFGNMIPRGNRHLSFPFEMGFQYTSNPTVALNLTGSACDPNGQGCEPIADDPQTQANIRQEQQDLTNDLSPLRFFPIVSIGISYKFGR